VGRFEEALKSFERIEAADPSFEPAYCNRIITYSEIGQHEKAEEMFYLARLYKDQCPHCYYNIGCSLAARGLFDKAIYCWQKTLDLDEDHPEVHVRIAEAQWSKGQLEQARRHYLIGLRHNPGAMQTLLDLGDLLLEMGLFNEAGEKFRRAMEQAPDNPSGYFCHGNWLMKCERDDEAIVDFKKVLKLDPTYPGAHLRLAQLFHRKGSASHARRHLRGEVMLHPEDPHILMDLASLLLDNGDSRAAMACLKRLVKLQPDNNAAWQNLAVTQFAQQRFADGIESCQEALRCEPTNLVTLFNLALAHEHRGEYERALVYVRRGLANGPGDVSLQRLEFRLRALKLRAKLRSIVRAIPLIGARVR
jgi:tetratricopeptide (TPR) repeat protein